jgi:hypothetical protein
MPRSCVRNSAWQVRFSKRPKPSRHRRRSNPPFTSSHAAIGFGLSMPEGREYTPDPVPDFDFCRCMEELSIRKEPYQAMSGNSTGYAKTAERIIAVSPLAFDPFKTTAHEIAHVILHPNIFSDHNGLPRDAKEVEAELTAYLVKSALGRTENLEFSRGYVHGWMDETTMEKVRLEKVFCAADAILKAGRAIPVQSTSPTPAVPQPVLWVPCGHFSR